MNHTAYDRASDQMRADLRLNPTYSTAYGGNFNRAREIGNLFVSHIFHSFIFFSNFLFISFISLLQINSITGKRSSNFN